MGCDIHTCVEQYDEETKQWFLIKHDEFFEDRNYEFFAALAGVRGQGPKANDFPKNASLGTKREYESWGVDAHSACHYSLEEFLKIYTELDYSEFDLADLRLRKNNLNKDETEDHEALFYPRETYAGFSVTWNGSKYNPDDKTYRVICWFDN